MDGLATVDYDIGTDTLFPRILTASTTTSTAIHLTAEGADTLDFSIRQARKHRPRTPNLHHHS